MLNTLSPELQARLRSGVAIGSVAQCIEELVLNSLDAGAICVAVRVDLAAGMIQVIDNGCGISQEELEKVANRYMTSKCHSVADLDNLCHFGYRGEALASIRDICSLLEIESRAKTSLDTYTRLFHNGTAIPVSPSKTHRPSAGTTIIIHDLFHKLPVRQRHLNPTLELERVRHCMEALALIHPNISFSLRNDATNQKILQTTKTCSVLNTFRQIYGGNKSRLMMDIAGDTDELKVQGYLSRDSHHNKTLQFIYINGRLVLKTRLHKLINNIISRSSISRQKGSPRVPLGGAPGSPARSSERYGMFIINITCPLSVYDITFDPAKTLVEFQDWNGVLGCTQTAVEEVLIKEGLIIKEAAGTVGGDNGPMSTEKMAPDSPEMEEAESETNSAKVGSKIDLGKYGARISTWNANNSRQSVTVRRPQSVGNSQEEEEDMSDVAANTELLCTPSADDGESKSASTPPGQLLAAAAQGIIQDKGSDQESQTPLTKLYQDSSDNGANPESSTTDSDPHSGDTTHKSSFAQGKAWCRTGTKPLPEPMMTDTGVITESSNTGDTDNSVPIERDTDTESPSLSALIGSSPSPDRDTQPAVRDRTFISLEAPSSGQSGIQSIGDTVKMKATDSNNSCKILSSSVTSQHIGLTPLLNLRQKLTSRESAGDTPSSLQSFRQAASQSQPQPSASRQATPDLMQSLRNIQARWRNKRKASETTHDESKNKHLATGKAAANDSASSKVDDDHKITRDHTDKQSDIAKNSDVRIGGDNQTNTPVDSVMDNETTPLKKSENHSPTDVYAGNMKPSTCGDSLLDNDCVKSCDNGNNISRTYNEATLLKDSSGQSTSMCESGDRLEPSTFDITVYDKSSLEQRKRKSERQTETLSSKLSRLSQRCADCCTQKTCPDSDSDIDFKFTPRPMIHHDGTAQDTSSGNLGNFLTTESLVQTAQTTDFTAALSSLGSSQESNKCSQSIKPESASPGELLCSVKRRLQQLYSNSGIFISDISNSNPQFEDLKKADQYPPSGKCYQTSACDKPEIIESNYGNKEVISGNSEKSNDPLEVKSTAINVTTSHLTSKPSLETSVSDSLEEFRQSQFRKTCPPKLPCFKNPWINKSTKHVKNEEKGDDNVVSSSSSTSKLGNTACLEQPSQSRASVNCDQVSDQCDKSTRCDQIGDKCDKSSNYDQVPNLLHNLAVPDSSSEDDAYSVELGSQIWNPMDVLTPFVPKNMNRNVSLITSSASASNSPSPITLNSQGFTASVALSSQHFSPGSSSTQPFDVSKDSSELNDSGIVPDMDLKKPADTNPQKAENCLEAEQDELLTTRNKAIETEFNPQFAMVTDFLMKQPQEGNIELNDLKKAVSPSTFDADSNLSNKNSDLKMANSDSDKTPAESNIKSQSADEKQHSEGKKCSDDLVGSSVVPDVEPEPVKLSEVSSEPTVDSTSDSGPTDVAPSQTSTSKSDDVANKSDDIIFMSSTWICRRDPNTGRKQYINRITGCSSFEAPGGETQNQPGRCSEALITGTRSTHNLLSSTASEFLRQARQDKQASSAVPSTSAGPAAVDTGMQGMLHQHQDEDGDTEAGVKWRQGQPDTGEDTSESLVQLWTEWENATKPVTEKSVLNIEGSSSGRQAVAVSQAIHPYTFSRDSVAKLKVLGQLDNKFIMCLLPSTTHSQKGPGLDHGDVLVVVDQHAAHERIRLEKLTAESIEETGDGQTSVKACRLSLAMEITLTPEDVRIMKQYTERFTSIGISFDLNPNDRSSVSVTEIPACFMDREASEQRRGRSSVATDKIEMLLKRQVELLRSTHGASGPLPREIHDVLCSQACHGAIKFGDALTQGECEQLIEWLSHCKLPFQCAHGRPSIIPLINMQHLRLQFPEQPKKKPRLYRLQKDQSESI